MTSSVRFDIGTFQNLARCPTTAGIYNTNLFDFGKPNNNLPNKHVTVGSFELIGVS